MVWYDIIENIYDEEIKIPDIKFQYAYLKLSEMMQKIQNVNLDDGIYEKFISSDKLNNITNELLCKGYGSKEIMREIINKEERSEDYMIEELFHMNKIKYEVLDKMTFDHHINDTYHIFINLECILKYVLSTSVCEKLGSYKMDYIQRLIVSNIINIAQHYRAYILKNHKKCYAYVYWDEATDNNYVNRTISSEYREYYLEKWRDPKYQQIVDIIRNSMKDISIFSKYFKDIYIIPVHKMESSLVPLIIQTNNYSKSDEKDNYILVTKDTYEFQYLYYGFDILIPHDIWKEQNGVLLTSLNVWDYLKDKYKCKKKMKEDLSTSFLPLIPSVLGNDKRNISKIPSIGISKLLSLIENGISKLDITPNTTSVQLLKPLFPDQYKGIFEKNYLCSNLEVQYQKISHSQIYEILSYIVDKYDDNELYNINEKYFKDTPFLIIQPKSEQVLKEEG